MTGHWTWGMSVSVLLDSWYGAWCCHAIPTFSVPICLCTFAGFSKKDEWECDSKYHTSVLHYLLETHCMNASIQAVVGQPGLTSFPTLSILLLKATTHWKKVLWPGAALPQTTIRQWWMLIYFLPQEPCGPMITAFHDSSNNVQYWTQKWIFCGTLMIQYRQ